DGRLIVMRGGHQFVGAAATENDCASIAVESVQSLITPGANAPDHDVIAAIDRWYERRPASALAHSPGANHSRRTRRRDLKGRKFIRIRADNVNALRGAIGHGCLDNAAARDGDLRNRRTDTTQISSVQEVAV